MYQYKLLITIFIVLSTLSSHAEDLNSWSLEISGDEFAKNHLTDNLSKNSLFDFKSIQVVYKNREVISDGITEIEVSDIKISLVAAVKNIAIELNKKIRPKLPPPGCKDSIGVTLTDARNKYPNDARFNNNKAIKIYTRVNGKEVGCGFPHTTNYTFYKDFWIEMPLVISNNNIHLTSKLYSTKTEVDIKLAGKIAIGFLDILDSISELIGEDIDTVSVGEIVNKVDGNINYEVAKFNQILSGEGLIVDKNNFFVKKKNGKSILSSFKWDTSSGFQQGFVHLTYCANQSIKRKVNEYYTIHFDLSSKKKRAIKVAKNIDSELKKFWVEYAKESPAKFKPPLSFNDYYKKRDISWNEQGLCRSLWQDNDGNLCMTPTCD